MTEIAVFLKMFRFLIAVACLANLTQAVPQIYGASTSDGKVVGGQSTSVEKHPYQTSLTYYTYHVCGAVVIGENFVLTAAHCTEGYVDTVISSNLS